MTFTNLFLCLVRCDCTDTRIVTIIVVMLRWMEGMVGCSVHRKNRYPAIDSSILSALPVAHNFESARHGWHM